MSCIIYDEAGERKGNRGTVRNSSPGKLTPAHNVFKGGIVMDYDIIISAISTLGFPIVVSAALFWYVNKQQENHKEEITALRDTIQENTTILHELKELIKVIAEK